jgi:hypothetical protein
MVYKNTTAGIKTCIFCVRRQSLHRKLLSIVYNPFLHLLQINSMLPSHVKEDFVDMNALNQRSVYLRMFDC